MLRAAFALGLQAAMTKFAIAGQPSLSSVGMAPSVTRGLPPAAKPLTAKDLGMLGNPNSGGMPLTPTQMLKPPSSPIRVSPPKLAEDERPQLCTSCRKPKHYGPCTRVAGTPGEGVASTPDADAFIRTRLRGS